ncbi:hypothetical protein Kpho02_63680 [Kitasatospora phosalacinea]|uniref:Uncharacterized protein n=1 Tax=Kitasatospora phosalacinea TaxID=2065 RepID=A0A9W6QBK7_9ACTN|nr:hypothetical protein Kpho02_63680 [Kitasatospora phosalacinea]
MTAKEVIDPIVTVVPAAAAEKCWTRTKKSKERGMKTPAPTVSAATERKSLRWRRSGAEAVMSPTANEADIPRTHPRSR